MGKYLFILAMSFLLLLGVVFLDLGITGTVVLDMFKSELYRGQNLVIALSIMVFLFILISLTYVQLYAHAKKRPEK